jgi:hypothetical protein
MAAYSHAVTQFVVWVGRLAIPDLPISFAIRRDALPKKRALHTRLAGLRPGQARAPRRRQITFSSNTQRMAARGGSFLRRMSPCWFNKTASLAGIAIRPALRNVFPGASSKTARGCRISARSRPPRGRCVPDVPTQANDLLFLRAVVRGQAAASRYRPQLRRPRPTTRTSPSPPRRPRK